MYLISTSEDEDTFSERASTSVISCDLKVRSTWLPLVFSDVVAGDGAKSGEIHVYPSNAEADITSVISHEWGTSPFVRISCLLHSELV